MPSSPLLRLRVAVARMLLPKTNGLRLRMYGNAQPSRLTQGVFQDGGSEDSQLVSSLRNLRSRSRQLVRDAGYAKNAKRIVVNNVIGTGIKLQSLVVNQRGRLLTEINDAIEEAYRKWSCADSCHTGGVLHFHDLERMAMGQVMEAGEIFIRIHRRRFGKSEVPIALEVVEPERIPDGIAQPAVTVTGPSGIRLGIEVDEFHRPVAYWVQDLHPGDIRSPNGQAKQVVRVPAEDMIHLKITDRWPQTRGVPWMHSVLAKLGDMNGYSEAEIIAARAAANYIGVLETPEDANSLAEEQSDGSFQMALEPGTWMRTQPGEKAELLSPNRPNSQLDPFMRFMLREIAAGTGLSYESLSRDYSQSNYSSSRLALLDDRDVWRALQQWFIQSFRARLHREWLQAAVLAGAIPKVPPMDYAQDMEHFEAAIFRPRGWSWIDPTKEVAAFKDAVKSGFTTVASVIAQTGGGDDLEDVLASRRAELEEMREADLIFDTSPEIYVPAGTTGKVLVDPETGEAEIVEAPAPAASAASPKAGAEPKEEEPPEDGEDPEEKSAVLEFNRTRALRKRRHA